MKSIQRNLALLASALPCLVWGGAIDVKLSDAETLHFIECPAGTCDIGYSRMTPQFKKHKVEITRKFWMLECPVTLGQYKAINQKWNENEPRGEFNDPKVIAKIAAKIGAGGKAAVGGVTPKEIESFCRVVCDKIDDDFPEGYIVRLPTDAEWEYAFRCGGKLKEPNYSVLARGKELPLEKYEKIGVSYQVNYQRKDFVDCGVELKGRFPLICGASPLHAVKTRKPNDWGFYDMPDLCIEWLADTLDLPEGGKSIERMEAAYKTIYNNGVQDPILVSAAERPLRMAIAVGPGMWTKMPSKEERKWDFGFRLVIGPDLASEQKSKASAKP